ncbi:MAG: hypothetical protein JWM75_580, partial [Sphingomonas bacterium]|nr:hypothetical protein [Sphingomonas bacterium]
YPIASFEANAATPVEVPGLRP